MAISREKKEQLVASYREMLSRSSGVIFTSYSGLSVREMESLRRQVREAGGEFHVVKNRLVKLAFESVGLPLPDGVLVGTTALGFAEEDIPSVTKAIVELAKESGRLEVKGGIIDGKPYDAQEVVRLAELPPLPVLRAQLLGLLQTPATRLAGSLVAPARQLASVFRAYSEAAAQAA